MGFFIEFIVEFFYLDLYEEEQVRKRTATDYSGSR